MQAKVAPYYYYHFYHITSYFLLVSHYFWLYHYLLLITTYHLFCENISLLLSFPVASGGQGDLRLPATWKHGWSRPCSSTIPSTHSIPQDWCSPYLNLTNYARTMFTPTMFSRGRASPARPAQGRERTINMRVWTCNELRVNRKQTSCYLRPPWLRTNGVDTHGAAAEVINFDRLPGVRFASPPPGPSAAVKTNN